VRASPVATAGTHDAGVAAPDAVTFRSILFEPPRPPGDRGQAAQPACFHDLNLDQVVASVTRGREEYDLAPFFNQPLRDLGSIAYRHEVFRDLEEPAVWECVRAFAVGMRSVRDHLAQAAKLHYRRQQQFWFLDAVGAYAQAVIALRDGLAAAGVRSRGFSALRAYLAAYTASPAFTTLTAEHEQVQAGLAAVAYTLHIRGSRITVARYDGEPDYAADVEATFAKFRQGSVKDYRSKFRDWVEMNHVEAAVLDRVALLHPDAFGALDRFCELHGDFIDPLVADFDREVQFYVAYLEHVRHLRTAGLPFCYPRVSDSSKEVGAHETFDLALADKLVGEGKPVVRNGFALSDPERVIVVTGPNQGGKTTFARTFGQLHHLASIGCPVPGTEARLFLFDQIFTHFEREEDLASLRGKLEDDLVRIHEILSRATPRSVLVVNEIFTSTTFRDALFLGTRVLEQVLSLDLLCVYVTFVDELASLSEKTVSMVSTVDPADPSVRTFKVVRRPADGRAHAEAIARKHGLTYERLKERLSR
jgi:DNA mismatch repair protein MutS